MRHALTAASAAIAIAAIACMPAVAAAPKHGGVLRIYHRDNPPSASIHEEATISTVMPFMSLFNNLVLFDQHKRKNSLETIVPDLAESWSWDDSKTRLTFKLRHGVTWHDGKPFTAKDVKCTWDKLQGKDKDRFRKNPRAIWYHNLKEVVVNGDYEATFVLERPQPSLLSLLASGYSPVYPCHVSARDMRTKPIGTGPFKFVEFKRNESIKVVRNENYWKKGLPYLDAIEWRIIPNRSTRILAFIAGDFDMTFNHDVAIPLLKDVKSQAPQAICEVTPEYVSRNLIVNREAAPFDNPKIRKAMSLALDRQAFVTILTEGAGSVGGAMLPPPEGVWGMPKEMVEQMTGYSADVEKSRAEGRKIMESLGYSAEKPLAVKISTRNIAIYRDPAVILIDQLKHVHIAGELEVVDTSIWHAKVARKEYAVGMNLTGTGVDDPDVVFYEGYACKSERNYTNYCNPEVEKLMDAQSRETDIEKRKQIVWKIENILNDDGARPIIYHSKAGHCWQPYVKNFSLHENSIYNGWRFEDIWLDK